MRILSNQRGFSAIEGILGLLTIAVIAIIGVRLQAARTPPVRQPQPTIKSSVVSQAQPVAAIPTVKSSADLDKAQRTLLQDNLADTADTTQLDNQTSGL